MNPIKNAVFLKSSSKYDQCPPPEKPEYAFIGRSNVGKSSLINMLTNRKSLAKTSAKPGKTQLINHFEIDDRWYLVDLPGYGWAQVSKTEKGKWRIMIDEYLKMRENLVNVFVLVDSRIKPQEIDTEFMKNLGHAGIPFAIVFTKADKLGTNKAASNVAAYKRFLKKDWEALPPIFITSATKRQGQEEILQYINQLNQSAGR
jgi:GTP-binding protein